MDGSQPFGWGSTESPCSCPYVVPQVLAVLKTLKVESVLDIGCGNGALCQALYQQGYHVAGMEYDQQGYDIARQAYPRIEFFHGSVYDTPDSIKKVYPAGFDCVVATEVIEHLFSPRKLPLFATQLLKPKGYLLISTPYHGYAKNCLLSLFNKWDFHHGVFHEGGHIKFFSRKTLSKLLSDAGYRVIGFHGCGRLPYLWKAMLLVAQKQ